MILKSKNKDYTFTVTMKKLVAMNKKFNVKNFRDAFFKAYNDINFEFLAEILVALSEETINLDTAYEIMENHVTQTGTDYQDVYKLVAEEINDKSFFGKKMTKEELEAQMNNPLAGFDINEIMNRTTEKVVGEVVAEEFKGYKG